MRAPALIHLFVLALYGNAATAAPVENARFSLSSANVVKLELPQLNVGGHLAYGQVSLALDFSNSRYTLLGAVNGTASAATAQHPALSLPSAGLAQLNLPFLEWSGLAQYRRVQLDLDLNRQSFSVRGIQPVPLVLGAYTQGFVGDTTVVQNELQKFDQWAGKRLSLAGLFMDMEASNPAYVIPTTLNLLEQSGYSALINLNTTRNMAQAASGSLDPAWRSMAQALAGWLNAQAQRSVLLAPFPEMNGAWEVYGQDPVNYKLAYARMQRIFAEAGVPAGGVRWVFAPNGWSPSGQEFEGYYPGAASVDVVGFSGYNWGSCSNAAYKQWQDAATVFGPYLARMRAMAPDKPIFVMQVASTSVGGDKNAWLRDTYAYLAQQPNLRAALYFNIDKECDWQVFRQDGNNVSGYRDAVANPAIDYLAPADLAQVLR